MQSDNKKKTIATRPRNNNWLNHKLKETKKLREIKQIIEPWTQTQTSGK